MPLKDAFPQLKCGRTKRVPRKSRSKAFLRFGENFVGKLFKIQVLPTLEKPRITSDFHVLTTRFSRGSDSAPMKMMLRKFSVASLVDTAPCFPTLVPSSMLPMPPTRTPFSLILHSVMSMPVWFLVELMTNVLRQEMILQNFLRENAAKSNVMLHGAQGKIG